jgi:hypothetical protein
MSKVSSNAGKHPYLRPENASLFDNLFPEKEGLPFAKGVKFIVNVQTEYVDKKKNVLSYLDIVTYQKGDYEIGYDCKEFRWIMKNLTSPKRVEILKEKAHLTVLKKKHN